VPCFSALSSGLTPPTPRPPTIKPRRRRRWKMRGSPNAAADHQFVGAQLYIEHMNIVWVGAASCIGCCPNIRNGAAIAAPADIGCHRLWLYMINWLFGTAEFLSHSAGFNFCVFLIFMWHLRLRAQFLGHILLHNYFLTVKYCFCLCMNASKLYTGLILWVVFTEST